jgi:hypothetical protein
MGGASRARTEKQTEKPAANSSYWFRGTGATTRLFTKTVQSERPGPFRPEHRTARPIKSVHVGQRGTPRYQNCAILIGLTRLFPSRDPPNAYDDTDVLERYESQGKAIVVVEAGKLKWN